MKKIIFLVFILFSAVTLYSQAKEQIARELFGDQFIYARYCIFKREKIDTSMKSVAIRIPYTERILKKYAQKNKNHEGLYYLVPTIGLRPNTVKLYWD